jgi:hypothetical protein
MRAPVVLAATHHDPDNAMLPQALRVLPCLHDLYTAIVMLVTPGTAPRTIQTLRDHGLRVEQEPERTGLESIGLVRQQTLRLAAEMEAEYAHLCDWDRALHWAEQYPDELRDVVDAIPRHDLLVLGRTPRAFATHPRVQRDTEAIVNHAFGLAFGQELDITAASRGLSRRTIDALLALPNPEPTVGNDCAWPLYLARFPELVLGYAATEGLEWETPDRHVEEIAAAGGLDAWIADFDARIEHWSFRMRLALHEVEAIERWC